MAEASALVTRPNVQPFGTGRAACRRSSAPTARPSPTGLALVAEGRFDAMLTFRDTWEWDIAAGAILIAEAGGTVSDAEGGRIVVQRKGVPWRAGSLRHPDHCTDR
jgi:myo-inositol-1(or 4)-monophosphatase